MSWLVHLGVMRAIFDDDKAAPIMRAAPPAEAVDEDAGVAVSCCEDLPGAADDDVPAVDGAACVRREARVSDFVCRLTRLTPSPVFASLILAFFVTA